MNNEEITCKTALSESKLPDIDYSLNPYVGCMHKCAYCYVPNVLRIPRDTFGEYVKVKRNIPTVLSKELKTKKPGIVGLSTVTDPYQPVEKEFLLTKLCLDQLIKYDFPIAIQTKSSLVIRDKELISQFKNAEVMISIATLNDEHRKILEPNSSPISDRLKVLEEFQDTNVKTGVFFGPIYPMITSDEISKICYEFKKRKIDVLMIDRFNLKPGIAENLQNSVKDYPNLNDYFTKQNLLMQRNYKIIRYKVHDFFKNSSTKVVDAF
jgi:DNA repair photolyase